MNNYIDILQKKLEASFDLHLEKEILGKRFDLYGEFYSHNAKYLVVKKLKYSKFNVNENIYFKKLDHKITIEEINDLHDFISNNIKELINFRDNHMETMLTFIYQCEFPLAEDVIEAIKKFKYHKSFKFGFKGWTNAKLIVLNQDADNYFSNKFKEKDNDIFLVEE